MTITVDGVRYNLPQSGHCAVEHSRGPELDYDYEYAHEHEFGASCVACGGRLTGGQLNVTVFQTFVYATVGENLSPTDAARLIRHGESDSVRTAGAIAYSFGIKQAGTRLRIYQTSNTEH
jgi:hypothetical protein